MGIVVHRVRRQLNLISIDWCHGGRKETRADRGGGEEGRRGGGGGEDNDDGKDGNKEDKDDEDAVPPCRPGGQRGRVKSLGSPIHPRVILPPPRGRGIVVIEGRGD